MGVMLVIPLIAIAWLLPAFLLYRTHTAEPGRRMRWIYLCLLTGPAVALLANFLLLILYSVDNALPLSTSFQNIFNPVFGLLLLGGPSLVCWRAKRKLAESTTPALEEGQ